METQLSECIGHFFYNEERGIDNSWILKPVNMTRSMDMIVTDNIDQIIRNVETGPKICQKYLNKPFLYKNRKFDLRFIILLKKLVPLELYMYDKVFWVRVANKDFDLDSLNLNDYERHFTVMNYNKDVKMQQVFNTDFLEYLKQNNIDWNVIYDKIKQAVKDTFITAAINCPQMTDYYARSIYGLDIMLDENLQPYVLEFNFSPDCTRACKFTPEFFDDIFSTLFLNETSGVTKI
jgi:tubulin--tyrosine ligase-like protein 12